MNRTRRDVTGAGTASRTLDDLDPPRWDPPPPDATNLMRTCHRLRTVPLAELGAGDLRVLVSQQIGLAHVLPLAVRVLVDDPLIEASYYDGDLLLTVVGVPEPAWAVHDEAAATLSDAIDVLPRSALAALPESAGRAIEDFVVAHGSS